MADLPDHRPAVAGATGWLHDTGLGPGDRVVTLLGNDEDAFALGLACMLAGVVQVPLPPDLHGRDLREVVEDADPALVLADPDVVVDPGTLDDRVVTAPPEGGWAACPGREPGAPWPRTRPMAYTSGTTGRRKGVTVGVHDAAWGEQVVADEHAAFDHRHGDRHLVVSPLYHSGPFRFAAVTALTGGRVAVLPRFDVEAWQAALRELRPTSMFCVPTHLHRLLEHPDTDADLFSSLDLLAHAGAPCPVPLKERLFEVVPHDALWEFYGSTEGQFTVCPPDLWRTAPGTVGAARPGRRLEVRDAGDDGVGTVWAHVPEHARWEYWRAPDRTAEAWDGDAFTVGDLGRLDDNGRLHLHGRPGDLVITGGVNVHPAEVERCLLDHPDVGEAAVYGVPDDDWGERVTAAVVPHAGRAPSVADLEAHARANLRRAQVPKAIRIVADLPRTPTGKIARVGLADAVEEHA